MTFLAGVIGSGFARDPYWADVVTLLRFDGVDGATAITDETGKHVWTANGNAQIDTTQSKFGGSSLLLDGSGDYLATPNSSDFQLGGDDFTIEAFIYQPSRGDSFGAWIISKDSTTGSRDFRFFTATDGTLEFVFNSSNDNVNGKAVVQSTGSISLNTWTHVAVCRAASSLKLFIAGALDGSVEVSTFAQQATANQICVGTVSNPTLTSGTQYKGNIDSLRVTKGYARYTASFAPPLCPYPNR